MTQSSDRRFRLVSLACRLCLAAFFVFLLPAALGAQPIRDGGFELGTPNSIWEEFSANFDTPLCSESLCGLGGGTGPYRGEWWAWFGGVDDFEEGLLAQTVTVPSDAVALVFHQELPFCSGDPNDFFEIVLGNTQLYEVNGNDPSCGTSGYRPIAVPIANFRGQTLRLELYSITGGSPTTNFFIDDLYITSLIFADDFESADTGAWSSDTTDINKPPVLNSVLATWSQLSDGRAIEIRGTFDVGGSSGIPWLLGQGLPREVDLDLDDDGEIDDNSPLLAQALGTLRGGNPAFVPTGVLGPGLPSSMALVVAEGSDPENDELIYRWQWPATNNVSYYSTGGEGSAFATGDLITDITAYNRNSILVEAPDFGFTILDSEIHIGGLFPVTVSVTDSAHAALGCPPGVPNSCRSFWNFQYDRGIELGVREVRGQLLDLNDCDHPVPGDPDIGPNNPADTVEVTFVAGISTPSLDANRFEALPDVWFRVACNAPGLGVGDDHNVDMPPGGPTAANVHPDSYLARVAGFIGSRVGGGARISCRYPLADPENSCASTGAWKSSASVVVLAGTFGPSTGAWPFVSEAPSYPPITLFIEGLDIYGPSLADRESVPIEAFETEDVTFTLFDSGSLADDSFRLEIDGITQGTTPPGGESVFGPDFVGLGELTAGSYEVCVTVTLAPDDIGTYTLNVFGATFTGGGTAVSASPSEGTRTCYGFDVPLNRLPSTNIPIGDGTPIGARWQPEPPTEDPR